jgi:hypothetical protein
VVICFQRGEWGNKYQEYLQLLMRGILESAKLFSGSDSWVVISAKFLRLSVGAVEKDIGVVKGKGQLLASSGLPRPRPWPIDNELRSHV